MPLYEYRCVACDEHFEQRRAMAEADTDVSCSSGHTDVRRLLSVFASSRSGVAAPATVPSAAPMRGCGGGCACH